MPSEGGRSTRLVPGANRDDRPVDDFVVIDGLRLHLLDWVGEGRPIVLIHGAGGHAWMWHAIAPGLRQVGHPVALDLRGYGDSQWSLEKAYETEDHAQDVAALCAALFGEPVDLVGFSWGGLVALAVAARNPGLVRRLAIIDIPPASELPVTAIPPNFRGRFDDHDDAVEAERELAPRAGDQALEVMAALGTRSDPDGGLTRKLDPYFLTRWPFRADDWWDELDALSIPTLIVHAEESVVLAADTAERMAAGPADARIETIPASGHLVALEQPEALARVLRGHLDETE